MPELDAKSYGSRSDEWGDLPKPPRERGGACRSQMTDAALLEFMQAYASEEMKVCGEPVFRSY